MKIYLASDHAGFEMKESINLFLELEKDNFLKSDVFIKTGIQNIEIVDFGAYNYNPEDDYPEFISICASALSGDIYTGVHENIAIVFGGSGEGEAMVADKYLGVRAGVINGENLEIIKLLKEHNNANILSIGARFVGVDFVKSAIKLFLETEFKEKDKNGEKSRHERRIEEIQEIEEKELNKMKKKK